MLQVGSKMSLSTIDSKKYDEYKTALDQFTRRGNTYIEKGQAQLDLGNSAVAECRL